MILKWVLKAIWCEDVEWIYLAQDINQWQDLGSCKHGNEFSGFIKRQGIS
jgi:hypothetical protein